MEYYLAIKRNERLNLKIIMLHEKSQIKKICAIGFHSYAILENANSFMSQLLELKDVSYLDDSGGFTGV